MNELNSGEGPEFVIIHHCVSNYYKKTHLNLGGFLYVLKTTNEQLQVLFWQ